MKQTFIMRPELECPSRRNAIQAILQAPDGYAVTISEPNRSLEQNAMLWPLLTHWSKQIQWPVDGKMQSLSPEDWKNILTAAFRRETGRIASGLDGGMVLLGARTRDMGKREFSDFLEFIQAAASERGIRLSNPTEKESAA